MPEMKGGVAIEHSHRLLASAVGLMTIVLSILLWKRRREDKKLQRMGVIALVLVIVQGLLGGVTVIYQLPSLISTTHLAVSMLFFSLLIVIAWKTNPSSPPLTSRGGTLHSPSWDKRGLGGVSKKTHPYIFFVTAMVYLQIILGAFIRHTEAGLICPELPLCYGFFWPSSLTAANEFHMAHRIGGIIVALLVFSLPLFVKDRLLSVLASLLVFVQIALGMASIWTLLMVPTVVTAHLGVAALLLAVMVLINLENS